MDAALQPFSAMGTSGPAPCPHVASGVGAMQVFERQFIVEEWSRHPAPLFRGQGALGYGEIERLTSSGKTRSPLRLCAIYSEGYAYASIQVPRAPFSR